jgi:hypothetical protein
MAASASSSAADGGGREAAPLVSPTLRSRVWITVGALTIVATLTAAEPSASGQSPRVMISARVVGPRPDPEDTANPLGRRQWDVGFDVVVSAEQTCDQLRYAYRTVDLFDGRLGLDGTYAGGTETSEAAQRADFGVTPSSADAGDTIVFTATGFCSLGGMSFRSAPVRLEVPIPPHSCDEGPLRVLRLHGRAWREDLERVNRRVPLHAGHYVWEVYTAWLGRGGRIVFGAPVCNGFRIWLRGGRVFFPGAYQRHRRGVVTGIGLGALARFTGDQHAGGIETENALVGPRGRRSGPSRVAKFDVFSYPANVGRLTRVRVLRGAAWVWGGPGAGAMSPPVLVRAGYVTIVRCTSYRHCRPDPPQRRG